MILGLDLSTKSSGIAVFDNGELIYHTCIKSASTDLIKRIRVMTVALTEVLDNYAIEDIYVEEVLPEGTGKNLKTHKALMYLQAALEFLVHDRNDKKLKLHYIYPSSWRAP